MIKYTAKMDQILSTVIQVTMSYVAKEEEIH